MPVIYMFVYLDAGLYADFGMQIYYTLAAIYGFILWKWGDFIKHFFARLTNKCLQSSQKEEIDISHFPKRCIIPAFIIFLILWGILYEILINFTNSTVPVLDSFGNSLSFIGLWALSHKYIEQWLIWIVVDIELAALYIYKDLPFTAGLYSLYVIIAIAGYFKWKRMMIEQQS